MRIALAQLEIVPGDVEENLERGEDAIEAAAEEGADLVALPELFTVGYFAFECYARSADGLDGPTLERLAEAAAASGVAVLAGSVVEDLAKTDSEPTPADAGLANTAVLFDRDGTRLAVYRKHHLFGYGSAESRLLVPGERLAVADVGEFTVGVTTCYDLRFPELYRDLAERGVTLMLVPSAWPYPRLEHWQVLPRARAIENQCYVATINGVAEFDDATLLGRSTVFDPWGTPLASSGDEPTIVTADVDAATVERTREAFPAWRDRRR